MIKICYKICFFHPLLNKEVKYKTINECNKLENSDFTITMLGTFVRYYQMVGFYNVWVFTLLTLYTNIVCLIVWFKDTLNYIL